MHSIKFIRDNPDIFDAKCAMRHLEPMAAIILDLDKTLRHYKTEKEEALSKRNQLSREVGALKKQGQDASVLMHQVQEIKDRVSYIDEQEQAINANITSYLEAIPNMPDDDVPMGDDEHDNVTIRYDGTIPTFSFSPKRHFELGEQLQMMDFETAGKLSGSRFVFLRKDLARLERALGNFMMDVHINEHELEETTTPNLVRSHTVYGTGQLPKFADDLYHTDDDYWLIPTAEVPLTAQYMGDIIARDSLPKRFCAWTSCYRSEAGAAGRDTRGMIRQHQFSKVEMVSITLPSQSNDELERMTSCAENILRKLRLPFRTILLCSGDMGFSARKTYDIEVWVPGEDKYREISSCSNCGDFQGRRLNMRTWQQHGQKGTEFLHSLNGSGLAVGRTLVAVMENYQQHDGSIIIPDILKPYMNNQTIIEAPR